MLLKPSPLTKGEPPVGDAIALTVVRVQCRPMSTVSGLSLSGASARYVPMGK